MDGIRERWRVWRRGRSVRRLRKLRDKARRNRSMVKEFIARGDPQTADEFIEQCIPTAEPHAVDRALGVRWAIARIGRVQPRLIHANDRFCDLEALPGWCERLDVFFNSIRLVQLIERGVGLQFTDAELERLPNPETSDKLTVGAFTQAVVSLCEIKAGPNG